MIGIFCNLKIFNRFSLLFQRSFELLIFVQLYWTVLSDLLTWFYVFFLRLCQNPDVLGFFGHRITIHKNIRQKKLQQTLNNEKKCLHTKILQKKASTNSYFSPRRFCAQHFFFTSTSIAWILTTIRMKNIMVWL